ncbi:uncharacterized protein G6M90_00g063130 [Metarhizium brunneum]|uniref:Uncharacterized protein n=1 Tax=Metarhizium brunneum TaxID=500148 RepID=A0A7D5UWW7_9HYPO|nr:hypothetical protein G6M90_00g063130 [Metarhizium brunneum]
MNFITLFMTAVATAVSATDPGETPNIGVTLYEHRDWQGLSTTVPYLDKCYAVPKEFNANCLNPALYTNVSESIRDLHETDDGDQIRSIFCTRIRFENGEWDPHD